ncbi:MAG: hypothetical protein Pg6B_08590 [Candidatus Azobacteroides pseudotrichonymphae]|nr:MAG: hypothetical protein Pg6B_08590 [Candidatus Azobacteroides pseudotrichonymphae]
MQFVRAGLSLRESVIILMECGIMMGYCLLLLWKLLCVIKVL